MWRLGTLLVLSVIFCCSSSAGRENGQKVRLRRSPYHPCPPYFYDSHPRHFPPPPPFWPPPPPPPPQRYFEERQNYDNDLQPQNFNQQSQAYSDAGSPANPPNQGEITYPDNKPCDKCEKGQSTAISNAKSVSGSAVAVAIAGKGNNAGPP